MNFVADWNTRDEERFHFIQDAIVEEEMVEIGVAGPGPSTQYHWRGQQHQSRKFQAYVLDEEDDTRFEVPHESAGKVIEMNPSLRERW